MSLLMSELRPLVLEVLSKKMSTQYMEILREVAELAINYNIIEDPKINRQGIINASSLGEGNIELTREIIWDLIFQRVLTIGKNSGNPNWPFLKLTQYGKNIAKSEKPTPHDPTGYLALIKKKIPDLDEIILTYLEESLNTYNINSILSSTICLGCASEKAILLLIEAFQESLCEKRKEEFIKNIKNKGIKTKYEYFKKRFSSTLGDLPEKLKDGIDPILHGVFEMIRNNRNDAGHPTGKEINKEQLLVQIQLFIPYCERIYGITNYLAQNKKLKE